MVITASLSQGWVTGLTTIRDETGHLKRVYRILMEWVGVLHDCSVTEPRIPTSHEADWCSLYRFYCQYKLIRHRKVVT